MIVIIDYDMGNVGSIKNILRKITKDDIEITRDLKLIEKADKLILPGVGAFDYGMENLKKYELVDPIKEKVKYNSTPLLGICLGMQLLGTSSEEGKEQGLGLIPFKSIRFNLSKEYKVPHMGWDYVDIKKKMPIVNGLLDESQRYYFVHSYHAVCDNEENVLMECEYGYKFTAAVVQDNIYGFQFHPEKSHKFGMNLLRNFVEL